MKNSALNDYLYRKSCGLLNIFDILSESTVSVTPVKLLKGGRYLEVSIIVLRMFDQPRSLIRLMK